MKLALDEGAGAVGTIHERICELRALGKGAMRKVMPVQWPKASCEAIFHSPGNRNARPPGMLRELESMARAREAAQGESNGRDRGRGRFCFRLSRVRIRMRRDEIADASTGGGFIAPMDGDEERAGLLVMADDDLHDARAVRGRDAREPTVGKPSLV